MQVKLIVGDGKTILAKYGPVQRFKAGRFEFVGIGGHQGCRRRQAGGSLPHLLIKHCGGQA
jgi:hypothetical protein